MSAVSRRRVLQAVPALVTAAACGGLASCGGGGDEPTGPMSATRTWRMGFYPTPPSGEPGAIPVLFDALAAHGELVHIHQELPWTALLSGTSATDAAAQLLPLANTARARGLRVGFMADLTDGLDRAANPPQLVALGRSVTEAAVQQVYREYVAAVALAIDPDYLGLTAETNLVRLQAPAPLYAAVVQTANALAADLAAAGVTRPLMISIQVEVAWGAGTSGGAFQGVATDFADFPFTQWLGLSSYPYFQNATPEQLPDDYYTRVVAGRTLPVMVAEGGWTSASGNGITSSPDLQRRYVLRQAALLDSVGARAVIQTLLADIELSALPPDLQASLAPFAHIGLTNVDFSAKPALATWDTLRGRILA